MITESVSSVEGSRNRRRRKKKKSKYHGESSNASDDNYRSSGFSEPSTHASSDLSHSSFPSTSEPCTNGEDSKSIKNGSPNSSLSKQSNSRSLSNSVPNKAEHSVSKDATSLNGSP